MNREIISRKGFSKTSSLIFMFYIIYLASFRYYINHYIYAK